MDPRGAKQTRPPRPLPEREFPRGPRPTKRAPRSQHVPAPGLRPALHAERPHLSLQRSALRNRFSPAARLQSSSSAAGSAATCSATNSCSSISSGDSVSVTASLVRVSSSTAGGAGSVRPPRCRESDSPGSNPLPSQTSGASISEAGLKLLAGRAGAASAAGFGASVSAVPPYLRSDSPGRTKGTGTWDERGAGDLSLLGTLDLAGLFDFIRWPRRSFGRSSAPPAPSAEPPGPRPPRRRRRPRQRFAPGPLPSPSETSCCSPAEVDSSETDPASGTASIAKRPPGFSWDRPGRPSCRSPPRCCPFRPPLRSEPPACRTSRGGTAAPLADAFSSSSDSSGSSISRKSVTYRKASRSRPKSTKADCMPGRTRVTRPLYIDPASVYSFSRS